MLDIFNKFGQVLFVYLVIAIWLGVFTFVRFTWRCGLCGKINETGIVKFVLAMCDHMGIL